MAEPRTPLPLGPEAARTLAARRRDLEAAVLDLEVATDQLTALDRVLVLNLVLREALDALAAEEDRQNHL
jgi:hypothetical protein